MDLKQKLDTLLRELDCSIAYFAAKHKKTKLRANIIKITSVTFSALITVVLGLNSGYLVDVFRNMAIILGAVVTIINAVDAYYNFGALWVKNTITLSKLRELKRELYFYASGRNSEDITESILNEYLDKMQKILRDDIRQWIRIRERINSSDQNKEESKASTSIDANIHTKTDELIIDPDKFRVKKNTDEHSEAE
ncbi:DUF4231 domain-containing protein [Clostridium sp. SYSU_GA19001]|uniref:DUF4231 domain-containing protein n=1 Tax=Clostridium caldaquaticum TaxID=2940653 RepID=UPI002076DC07|nr:DUF4231 domain-containing protein [Clostridium caldaquaticum]MCM8709845.1 DUF4231 domain-containing protein [Clostridium caldaquaticum]